MKKKKDGEGGGGGEGGEEGVRIREGVMRVKKGVGGSFKKR